jgi:hypothetical protein
VSLPTRGVFAEAVMGDCNACEEIDDTRFWRWEESPIDEPPALDVAALASRRSEPNYGTPTPFPTPIVNIQNAPQAPEPAGVRAALDTLAKQSFADITGLAGTQANAAAAYAKAMDTALEFGKESSKLAQQAAMTKNVGQTMRAIDRAEAESKIDQADAKQMRTSALRTMAGETASDPKASSVADRLKVIADQEASGNITRDVAAQRRAEVMKGLSPEEMTKLQESDAATAAIRKIPDIGSVETGTTKVTARPSGASSGPIQYVSTDAGVSLPPIASAALGKVLVGDPNGQIDLAQAVVDHLNSLANPNHGSCVAVSASYFTDAMKKIGVPFDVIRTSGAGDAGSGTPVEMPVIATENGNHLVPRTLVTIWFSNATADNWMGIPSWCRGAGAPGALFYANLIENQALITSATGWPSGMKPGAHLQLWKDEAEFKELRDKGTVPGLGHSCVFQAYVSGSTSRIIVSDQMGVSRDVRYPLFDLRFVIAGNLSKAKLLTFT